MQPLTAIAPLLADNGGWGALIVFGIITLLSIISKIHERAVKRKQEREQAMRPQKLPQPQQQPPRPPLRRQIARRMETEDFEDDELVPVQEMPTGVRRIPSTQQVPPQLPRRPIPPTPRPSRKRPVAVEETPEVVEQPQPQVLLANVEQQITTTKQRLAMLQARRDELATATSTPGRLTTAAAPAIRADLGLNLQDPTVTQRAIILMELLSPPLALRDEQK